VLGFQHLLYHVASTTIAAAVITDIDTGSLDFRTSILRTYGTTRTAHNLKVGDIISHIHHLVVRKAVLAQVFLIGLDFYGCAQIDIIDTKAVVTQSY
jgi:hypothetical protein